MVCCFRNWWHSGMWSSASLKRNGNIWIQLRGTCIGMWWWRTTATWSHWVNLSAAYHLEYALLNISCFLVNPRLSFKKVGTFLLPVSRGMVEHCVGDDTSIKHIHHSSWCLYLLSPFIFLLSLIPRMCNLNFRRHTAHPLR